MGRLAREYTDAVTKGMDMRQSHLEWLREMADKYLYWDEDTCRFEIDYPIDFSVEAERHEPTTYWGDNVRRVSLTDWKKAWEAKAGKRIADEHKKR